MKKWSRMQKLLFWLAILLICFTLLYAMSGHSFTPEVAMRRLEKQNLVGPCQIIDRIMIQPSDFSNSTEMIVGISEYGYTVYSWSENNWNNNGYFRYAPKKDGVTVFLPLRRSYTTIYGELLCPVILFTEDGGGTSARLTLNFELTGENYTCVTEARRTDAGYFLFILSSEDPSVESINALVTKLGYIDGAVDAKLELYDHDGTLISSQQFIWTEPR